MNTKLIGASIGLVLAGPIGALIGWGSPMLLSRLRSREPGQAPTRLVLLLLIVELRSGVSALAALQEVARALPEYRQLSQVARLATVFGMTAAIGHAGPELRPVIAQLARSQRTGGALNAALRRLLEENLAADRARRLARARSLPVRLMLPVTLLMLPGLLLLLYAPSLLLLFDELTGAWP